MRRLSNRVSAAGLLLAASLFAAPAVVTDAEARGGGGKSFGSRGSQTFTAPRATRTAPQPARPMQRTVTQPGQAARPAAAPAAAPAGAAAAQASRGRMIMTGIAAGLLGAGLFGLLSGSGLFAGLGSLAGFFGLLLQLALIGGVVWLVLRLVRARRQPVSASAGPMVPPHPGRSPRDVLRRDAGAPHAAAPMAAGLAQAGHGRPGAAPAAMGPLDLEEADFNRFEALLGSVQTAYDAADIATLRSVTTPEIAAYFEEDLAENERKGLKDHVRDVKLLQGDLSEAWREGDADYATVAMRFALVEATVEVATGRVVRGDRAAATEATELWTFRRERGEDWRLSAIQQVEADAAA